MNVPDLPEEYPLGELEIVKEEVVEEVMKVEVVNHPPPLTPHQRAAPVYTAVVASLTLIVAIVAFVVEIMR